MSRSTRLLSLLQSLRLRRRPVTAAALARELGVSERTIYRDLSTLAAQGAPIQGEAGVGYILRPGLFLPPLMLTEDETDAVLLGLRYVDQRGDEVLRMAAAHARAKITTMLSREMQEAAESPTSVPGPDGYGFPQNVVPLAFLRTAVRTQQRLRITYVDQHDRLSERVVWPILLGFMDKARVMAGWCELRKAFRIFRTDRILAAEPRESYPGRRSALVRAFQAQMRNESLIQRAPDGN